MYNIENWNQRYVPLLTRASSPGRAMTMEMREVICQIKAFSRHASRGHDLRSVFPLLFNQRLARPLPAPNVLSAIESGVLQLVSRLTPQK